MPAAKPKNKNAESAKRRDPVIVTAYRHPPQDATTQEPNPEPGYYYVSAILDDRSAFLAGPFTWHATALACVGPVRTMAWMLDTKSAFASFGTARWIDETRPAPKGRLNDLLLLGESDLTAAPH